MSQRERNDLDRHITGNYGEDQFNGDITEYLINCLVEISNLPAHECDDARNVAALLRAKMIASDALAKCELEA